MILQFCEDYGYGCSEAGYSDGDGLGSGDDGLWNGEGNSDTEQYHGSYQGDGYNDDELNGIINSCIGWSPRFL